MEDVKSILADTNWVIKYVKRDANKVAHQLTQQAVFLSNEMIVIDKINPCIESQVMADCNSSNTRTHVMAIVLFNAMKIPTSKKS